MNTRVNVGQVYDSKSFGKFVVHEYVDAGEVYVKFLESGYISKSTAGNIRKGLVRDNLAKTVYGAGFFGVGPYRSRHPNNGPCTKEYGSWSAMMFRCYGESRNESTMRGYEGCSVCEEWHNFQTFAQWCQTQPEMLCDDSSLDKDIRVKGNKVYSPSTCCFVPSYINTAVTGMKHHNSTGRAGVWKFKESYVSEVTMFGAKSHLGNFTNAEDAEYIHRKVKNAYISALADIFKERLGNEVYDKLKEWE